MSTVELAAALSSACTSPADPPLPRESGRSMPPSPRPAPPPVERPMPWSSMWWPCLRSASCCSTICFVAASADSAPPPLIWCCRSRDASSADSSYKPPPNCCCCWWCIPSASTLPSGAFAPAADASSGQADGCRPPSIWSRKSSCTPPAARRSSREIWPAAAMACISRVVGCIPCWSLGFTSRAGG